MRPRIFLLLLTSLCCVNGWAQVSPTELLIAVEDVDELALGFLEENSAPAVSIAVLLDGQIVLNKGYGIADLENSVKATNETVFRTASIAKPLTAIAIMQLVEQGKLGLDDPIQDHCPEFPDKDDTITIRHLLCHQGGIRHYQLPKEAVGKDWVPSIAKSIELFADDKLVAKPGEKFHYTTYGFSLLGRAIETASGQTYREYMHENVFKPAGMESTGLDDHWRIIPHRARGYTKVEFATLLRLPAVTRPLFKVGDVMNAELHDTSMKVPGGGIASTSADLARMANAMLNDQLITAETRQQAWERQFTSEGQSTNYALGWGIYEDQRLLISHSGEQAGTSTMLMIFPQSNLAVVELVSEQQKESQHSCMT